MRRPHLYAAATGYKRRFDDMKQGALNLESSWI
jgi:hypothetical protein